MIIANAERAVVDIRKLRDYCLNPSMMMENTKRDCLPPWASPRMMRKLRDVLLQVVKTHEAQLGRRDVYKQRYIVDFSLTWHEKQFMIRSGWIIEHGTDTPRLTTCYPLQTNEVCNDNSNQTP